MCKCEELYFRSREEITKAYSSSFIREQLYFMKDEKEIAEVIFSVLEKEVRLSEIWVDPKFRKLGYGRRLVQAVQTVSRAVKKDVTLTTHFGAYHFFIKLGFEIIKDEGEPSVVEMVWSPKSLLGTKAFS